MNPPVRQLAAALRFVDCLRALAVLAAVLIVPGAGAQSGWPSKPLRVVVPYSGGGGTDILARVLGERLQAEISQTVMVENRPGANGVIGTDLVAKAAPDGETLAVVVGTHLANAFTVRKMPFDTLKSFVPVTVLSGGPLVLVAANQAPYNSVQGLLAHGRANPGKLSIGHSELGTRLAGLQFARMSGIPMVEVSYKGGALLMNDIIGGHVSLGFTSVLTALPFYKSGKLRILGVANSARVDALPDVPAITDAGLPGFASSGFYALLAPAGTPPATIAQVYGAVSKVLGDPAVKRRIVELGGQPVTMTPAQTRDYFERESANYARLIKEAGIQPED